MGRVIWITGAGSGIGKALALSYDDPTNTLILSGRNEEKLNELKAILKSTCLIKSFDVREEAAVHNAVSEVLADLGKVDVLINNAGISQRSLTIETDNKVGRTIMDINFFGAVYLTSALLPQFQERGSGKIIVISSLSGKFGFPLRSFYAASKHALHGYFETLSLELKGTNIDILIACPGRIKTKISTSALTGDGTPQGTMDNAQRNGMDPLVCAQKIKRASDMGKHEIYIGGKELLLLYIKRISPALFRFIAARVKPT